MRATLFQWCRTVIYLLCVVLFLWLGYWLPKHLFILDSPLDNSVLLVLQESPYLSFSIPYWLANVIAGVFLLCTFLLIVPNIRSLKIPLHSTTFCILLLLCVLPLISSIYSFAWSIGFMSLITPSGLGVREGVLSMFLSTFLPPVTATLGALLSRLWLLNADIIFAGIAGWIYCKHYRKD